MKASVPILIAALAGGCAVQEPAASSEAARSRLAEALAGRSAGEPVACVSQVGLRNYRAIGEGALLFDGPGGVVYVNRPAGGCPGLEFGRTIRTRTPSSQLCSGDIVTAFDPVSGAEFGGCGLGEFVPYRRVD